MKTEKPRCDVCGQPLGYRRRVYCSDECYGEAQERSADARRAAEHARPGTAWGTLGFPGAEVLWRRARSWKPHSQQRWHHLYEFEVRLLDGRVVRDEVVYEHAYPTEGDLRGYLSMLVKNLTDEPSSVHVQRMLGEIP